MNKIIPSTMKTETILILAFALRMNGVTWAFKGSQFPFVSRESSPSSSPLRVASSAWATNDDRLVSSTKTFTENDLALDQSRRSKVKAPLVDSTLLRFLSEQKNSRSVLLDDDTDTPSASEAISIETPNSRKQDLKVDYATFASKALSINDSSQAATTDLPSINGDSSVKSTENQSWLSQYNAQRVSLKLQALGVESEAANEVGKIVQDYVLARITRRRIRKFLQERDAMWESGIAVSDDRSGINENISFAAASKFDIDAVISVMTEYGLTGTDIAAVLSHTPSLAMIMARKVSENETTTGRKSFTLQDTLDKAFVGLLGDTLKLRRYDARKVLRSCPGLLTSKGSASAEQVVKLMVSLGSSTSSIARDKSSLPTLLSRSPALIFRLVAFLSSAQLKIPLDAIGPILRQKQSAEMLNAVAPMRSPVTLGGQDEKITANNSTNTDTTSDVLSYLKVDDTMRQQKIEEGYRSMEAVADVLRRNAGIRDFRKILSSYPHVFFVNITNVVSVTNYLREEVGMTKEDLAKTIQTFPTLLDSDVAKISSIIDFLISIEVNEDDLPSILRSFPATLTLDVDKNMVPVVEFLRGIGVRNIGRFVTRLPPVLGYSVDDDLRPKWEFLKEVSQFDYFEVTRFPAYFSYPLERVIKMRYDYLRDRKQIPIQLVRVDDVLRFGDRDFATEIALDDDNGAAFAKFVEERSCSMKSLMRNRRNRNKRPKKTN
mmetsp:Transcript_28898/g.60851  ORF Transcript_28898/g.60851 Transcript_28898/m.60851 type:complete len:718 (+) Transcript_28898:287-2440(+)